ncbi:MAG TPA: hypothetical protein VE010_08420, partial [Thermoanaerobaculia bacterium]|nr:hypothetical protein [Thermoanaerobaculia bacterium]
VAEKIESEARRTGASVDQAVNDAVRKVVGAPSFRVKPFNLGIPKVDLDCIAAALAADEPADQK